MWGASPSMPRPPMLYAMVVACAALIFTLARDISHAAEARHLRLLLAQQTWAEMMDHHDRGPKREGFVSLSELRHTCPIWTGDLPCHLRPTDIALAHNAS